MSLLAVSIEVMFFSPKLQCFCFQNIHWSRFSNGHIFSPWLIIFWIQISEILDFTGNINIHPIWPNKDTQMAQ